MATVQYGDGGVSFDSNVYFGWYTKLTNTEVDLVATNGMKFEATGTFAVTGGNVTDGVINTYSIFRPDGSLLQNYSGLNLSAYTYASYVYSNNVPGLYALVMSGNDVLKGGNGNDVFVASGGDDTYDGGGGLNTVRYAGPQASYTITRNADNDITLHKPDGTTDSLYNVERVVFSDNTGFAADISGNAGQAYRLYQAAFDRQPDMGGLGYWLAQQDNGMNLVEIAARFIDSSEFRSMYGSNPTVSQEVTGFYQHVLHRAPDVGGLDFYVNQIETGQKSVARVLAEISDSPENQAAVVGAISHGIEYQLWHG